MKSTHFLFCALTFGILCNSCGQNKNKKVKERTDQSFEMVVRNDPSTISNNPSIWERVSSNSDFNSLMKLTKQAQMVEVVKKAKELTLFAPTNKAINSLTKKSYSSLRAPKNQSVLKGFLSYHMVKGVYTTNMIIEQIKMNNQPLRLKTLQDGYISIRISGEGSLEITDEMGGVSKISKPDLKTSNGIIQGVDAMLIPQMKNKLED